MTNILAIKRIYDRDVKVYKMLIVYLNLYMHNHFGIEIFCPNRDVV